jgi:hypothetical protein
MAKIRLGHRYRDIILGTEGTAMEIGRHLTGCDRVRMRFMDKEGNEASTTLDTTRLKLIPSSKLMEHKPLSTKIKLGEIYQDTSTGIIGHAVTILERVGLANMLVVLEYKDERTGRATDAVVDEPLLKKVDAKTVEQAQVQTKAEEVKEAGKQPKKNGPGVDHSVFGSSF